MTHLAGTLIMFSAGIMCILLVFLGQREVNLLGLAMVYFACAYIFSILPEIQTKKKRIHHKQHKRAAIIIGVYETLLPQFPADILDLIINYAHPGTFSHYNKLMRRELETKNLIKEANYSTKSADCFN